MPWNKRSLLALATIAWIWLQGGERASAQDSAADAWPLERVKLVDGRELAGLLRAERDSEVELVEVRRPPGKPAHLAIHALDRREIASWQRLEGAERAELAERVRQLGHRATIEARRMASLALVATRRDEAVYHEYRGPWFTLTSTADEPTTRRAIVRLEQVLAGYRQLLPPRAERSRPFDVLLFGEVAQYRRTLRGMGLEMANPAFFAADFNQVVAGSDVNLFQAQLAKVRRENAKVREEFAADQAAAPERLRKLAAELAAAGWSDSERQTVLVAQQRQLDEQAKDLEQRHAAAERTNAARLDQVMRQMSARLYHEAFHAYLENYVYPHRDFAVPRWLNEGLAQTFEAGVLEADTLRVDAPNPVALAALQADLRSGTPLPLAELLSAEMSSFLAAHRANPDRPSRLYLYSWGLAYYLAVDQHSLTPEVLDKYVGATAADQPAVARFERLVGRSLADFETRWRRAMLELGRKSNRGPGEGR